MLKELDANKINKEILLFLAVFLINLIVSVNSRMIRLYHDEFCVLAISAFFTGKDWSSLVQSFGYYGYGQAILYIPLFLIIKNPIHLFQSLIVLNSVIISIIPVLAYRIFTRYIPLGKEKYAVLVSLLASVYPGNLLYSKLVWNETVLYLVPWLLILSICRATENINKKNSIIIALILVFGYATHGRAIGFIVVVCIGAIIYYLYTHKNFLHTNTFIITLLAGLLLNQVIKNILLLNLWKTTSENQVNNTLVNTIQRTVQYINIDGLKTVLIGMAGHIYYTATASIGLFLIAVVAGVLFVLHYTKSKHNDTSSNDERIFFMTLISSLMYFVGLFIGVVFLLSGLIAPDGRGDLFIYGRYTDNLVSPVLAIGLSIILLKKVSYKRIFHHSVIIYVLLSIFSVFVLEDMINARELFNPLTVLPIMPYIKSDSYSKLTQESHVYFLVITVLVLCILFVGYKLFVSEKKIHGILLYTLFFLFTYWSASKTILIPLSDVYLNSVESTYNVFCNFGDLNNHYNRIYLIGKGSKVFSEACYQFILPDYKVINYNEPLEKIENTIENNSIIISNSELWLHSQANSKFRKVVTDIAEVSTTDSIYVYGEEIDRYFNENLPVYTKNGYDEIIPISSFQFPNKADNEQEDTYTVSNGKEGFLAYGPYIYLQQGNYIANIELELRDVSDGMLNETALGRVDIAVNKGEQIAWANLLQEDFDYAGNTITISLPFVLDTDVDDLEIRTYINENVYIKLNSVAITNAE